MGFGLATIKIRIFAGLGVPQFFLQILKFRLRKGRRSRSSGPILPLRGKIGPPLRDRRPLRSPNFKICKNLGGTPNP